MFSLVVRLKAMKGKEKDVERVMREVTEKVRQNENDTLMYDMHRKISDSTEILLYERYTDRHAWEVAHMSKPYIKELLDELAKYIEGKPELTEYEVIENL
jgi:quinol monooxygenase YgiN